MLGRRGFLAATLAGTACAAAAHGEPPPSVQGDHGRLRPPVPLPPIALTLQDGTETTLAALVRGRTTAIQLMFPTCTTTCPLGAATFAQVQDLLPDQVRNRITLLSLDIAPFGDRPAALAAWLARFGARPGWIAATPRPAGLPTVQALFDEGRAFSDNHSDRVHIVDRAGNLAWRTYELPSAEDIAALLTHV